MPTPNKTWLNARQSGALLHVSSLPSETGIGNLGAGAQNFVDFLSAAGFAYWQVCPVGPTGYGDSPYQSFSAFAGNPYFIDLNELVQSGLLLEAEVAELRKLPHDRVDYGQLYHRFWGILAKAHARFDPQTHSLKGGQSFHEFYESQAYWLDPYTTFMALKARFGQRSWVEWPKEYRDPKRIAKIKLSQPELSERSRHAFYQYVFFHQWKKLKAYANEKGVQIVGDIPIYVALDSADVWSRRDNFLVKADGDLDAVAGVPPDYFSETGQLWGNPLYNWKHLEKNGYKWWIERIGSSLELFDVLRFDHFRGFADFWVVPSHAPDASEGAWELGPGISLFQAIERAVPNAKFIAEDLGYINEAVFNLRQQTGYPGMKIMQFGYGHDDNNVNLPHFFDHNQVVYTGTHDNATTQAWIDSLSGENKQLVFDYFDLHDSPTVDRILQAAYASVARLVITPVQDLLGLGAEARMNEPGTSIGNWQWRLSPESFETLAHRETDRFLALHKRYHRVNDTLQRNYSAPPEKKAAFDEIPTLQK
ncbi:4-alpha-glucanotransferase [Pelagicoccus enzymogenes]|uniref:4-alpha-glucanotransferase n=1 Tax=Pelagicoccus enzymogenes TaxID=2773457 RepID=UPI00280DE380|nr:4-alpha-glucanotransferase [Pelagicoccus enzymogenes]MDQ8198824.1 4-alpha-glucanotransferase [Pelagicoccus enzymogenes]